MAKKPALTSDPNSSAPASESTTTSGQDLIAAMQAGAAADTSQQPPVTPESTDPTPELELDPTPPTPRTPAAGTTPTGDPPSPVSQPPAVQERSELATTQPDFVSRLREFGFQDVQDESEGRDRLMAAYRQQAEERKRMEEELAETRRLAALGQQYVEQLQDPSFQQFQAQRRAPAPKPESPAPEEALPWSTRPKFDPDLAARFRVNRTDEQGKTVSEWRDGTPAEIRDQYDRYTAWTEQWSHDLVYRPDEVLPKIAEVAAEKVVKRYLDERFVELEHKTELEKVQEEIISQNPWLFETNPLTKQPTNQFSQAGERAMELVRQSQEAGLNDLRMQWQYARNQLFVESYLSQQQAPAAPPPLAAAAPAAAPPPPAKPTPAERNAQYLRRQAMAASSRPGRAAATQDPDPEQSGQRAGRRRSSGHDLVEELHRTGVAAS